jgi:hypothetical protein
MKKFTKAEVIVRKRKIMLAIVISITVLFGFILFTNIADANESREVYTYYTSYQVQSGDSLWSIADQFMGPDFKDKQEFIDNMKYMNHMLDDNITAGNYLVIEYSSYEQL